VVDNSDEPWSVGGQDYLPSEDFGTDVVALDVELCRRWRSRWGSCGSITATSTLGHAGRRELAPTAARGPLALTNHTKTAGSGRCAAREEAAIVTKVTVGQYVKLQV
jgi:hypothetical protein